MKKDIIQPREKDNLIAIIHCSFEGWTLSIIDSLRKEYKDFIKNCDFRSIAPIEIPKNERKQVGHYWDKEKTMEIIRIMTEQNYNMSFVFASYPVFREMIQCDLRNSFTDVSPILNPTKKYTADCIKFILDKHGIKPQVDTLGSDADSNMDINTESKQLRSWFDGLLGKMF